MSFCCLKSVAQKRDPGKAGMLVEALLGKVKFAFFRSCVWCLGIAKLLQLFTLVLFINDLK